MCKKLKKYIPIIIFILIFSLGLLIMLYPSISSYLNSKEYEKIITEYEETTTTYSKNSNTSLFDEANIYNQSLTNSSIIDVFSDPNRSESKEYHSILNINNKGVMGYISIPKIDIKIPIYHGTSSKVLEKGVGHLEGSSFPIGGISTHSILSAHRGLPSSRLFTDLDQLKEGDTFYIYILDRTLAYEVDQIVVVEPSETEALRLQEGKDYITLVTCTPYAINTHRLLVRGTRVEYNQETQQNIIASKEVSNSDLIFYIGLAISIILLLFGIVQIKSIEKNYKGKHQQKKYRYKKYKKI